MGNKPSRIMDPLPSSAFANTASANTYARRIVVVGALLFALLIAANPSSASAQDSAPADSAAADTTAEAHDEPHPNEIPYRSSRSVGGHLLALPSYLLQGVVYPIEQTALFVERNWHRIRPPDWLLPRVDIGGSAGILVGADLTSENFLQLNHRAGARGSVGADGSFDVSLSYRMPRALGPQTGVAFEAQLASDADRNFFVGGNRSELEDQAQFARDRYALQGSLLHDPQGAFSSRLDLQFEHVEAIADDGAHGELRITDFNLPGLEAANLLTSGITLGINRTQQQRLRTYAGTEITAQAGYTHDLSSNRFQYGRYAVEVAQYVPVFFLPEARRLAFRARLEQVEPMLGGSAIPFHQLPLLGSQSELRGFDSNRFRDEGSLLLTAEYRYPIWDQLDAVIFADAGQVFSGLDQIGADRFHWSYGGGVHLLASDGLRGRFEVAGSREGVRLILTVTPAFGPAN